MVRAPSWAVHPQVVGSDRGFVTRSVFACLELLDETQRLVHRAAAGHRRAVRGLETRATDNFGMALFRGKADSRNARKERGQLVRVFDEDFRRSTRGQAVRAPILNPPCVVVPD